MSQHARVKDDHNAFVLLALTSLMMALPVLLFRWPPVGDLADHELILAILVSFGDPVRFPETVYQLNFGSPNQLLFVLGYGFAVLFGPDLGIRILLAAILFTVPWGLAHAARTLDRSPLTAVVMAPFALGFAFRYGLIAYLLAMVMCLFVLRPFEALVHSPSPRKALIACLSLAVTTLTHGASIALFGLLAAPAVLRRWRTPSAAFWIALPILSSLALFVGSMFLFNEAADEKFRVMTDIEIIVLERLELFLSHLTGYYLPGATPLALCALAALVLAVANRGGVRGPDTSYRVWVAMFVFLQYWIWPDNYNGAGFLHLRFLLPGVWLLALAVAPRATVVPRRIAVMTLLVPAAFTAALLPEYVISSRDSRALDRLKPLVAEGSSIAWLDFNPVSERFKNNFSIGRPAAHLVAALGGRTWSFTDAPQYPVQSRVPWWSGIRIHNPYQFMPEFDLLRYRYVLARITGPRAAGELAAGLGNCVEFRAHEPPFVLFESRCLEAAIHHQEPPLPSNTMSLGMRLSVLDRAPTLPSPMPLK